MHTERAEDAHSIPMQIGLDRNRWAQPPENISDSRSLGRFKELASENVLLHLAMADHFAEQLQRIAFLLKPPCIRGPDRVQFLIKVMERRQLAMDDLAIRITHDEDASAMPPGAPAIDQFPSLILAGIGCMDAAQGLCVRV